MAARDLVVRLTIEERALVSKALLAYSQEFFHVAELATSAFVRETLEETARSASALRTHFDEALNRVELNATVARELALGNKINAIKAVRAATTMGLREAKDYVDNYVETDPNYGLSKF